MRNPDNMDEVNLQPGYTVYVSSAGFKNLKTLPNVLAYLAEGGIKYIELSGGLDPYEGNLLSLLREWADKSNFKYITHNYFPVPKNPFILNIASVDQAIWKQSIKFCSESLLFASEIGSPIHAVHAGYAGTMKDQGDGYFFSAEDLATTNWSIEVKNSYEQLLRAVDALAPLAKKAGVKFCIENLFPMNGLPPQLMTNEKDWKQFKKDTEGSGVGFLIDIAHLKIAQHIGEVNFNKALNWALTDGKASIYQIHLSETDGSWDSHSPLSEDSWVFTFLEEWSKKAGWPKVPISYESRGLSVEHLEATLQRIRSSLSKGDI